MAEGNKMELLLNRLMDEVTGLKSGMLQMEERLTTRLEEVGKRLEDRDDGMMGRMKEVIEQRKENEEEEKTESLGHLGQDLETGSGGGEDDRASKEKRTSEEEDGPRDLSELSNDEDIWKVVEKKEPGPGEDETEPHFPLAGLNPSLLEKVFTKLDSTSYFRLQSTCRGVNELIRKSRNISVHLDGRRFTLKFNDEKPYLHLHNYGVVDVEDLHGTRVSYLTMLGEEGPFEVAYRLLKKHRVTCEALNIATWTTEECVALIKILNPVVVVVDSQNHQALFQPNHVRNVVVDLEPNDVQEAAPRLLSTFSEVDIQISYTPPRLQAYEMLRTILQVPRSRPQSKLQKFSLNMYAEDFCSHGMMQIFRKVNLAIREAWMTPDEFIWVLEMNDGYYCKIVLETYAHYVEVEYGKGYPVAEDHVRCDCCRSDGEDQE